MEKTLKEQIIDSSHANVHIDNAISRYPDLSRENIIVLFGRIFNQYSEIRNDIINNNFTLIRHLAKCFRILPKAEDSILWREEGKDFINRDLLKVGEIFQLNCLIEGSKKEDFCGIDSHIDRDMFKIKIINSHLSNNIDVTEFKKSISFFPIGSEYGVLLHPYTLFTIKKVDEKNLFIELEVVKNVKTTISSIFKNSNYNLEL